MNPVSTPLHVHGVVLPDGIERDVFVTDDGAFTFSDPGSEPLTVLDRGYLVPGLADVHAHLPMASPAGDEGPMAERVAASARAQVDAGVLCVREPGGARESATLNVGDGFPRVVSAGRWLAAPGRFLEGFATEVPDEALPEAALVELASSRGWVKVIGDWRPEGDEVTTPSYRADTLAAAVRTVHEAGGRVAIHATVREVVQAAIAAGCDSIEHGRRMEQAEVEAMAGARIAYVPTLSAIASPQPPEFAERPEHVRREILAEVERHPHRVREAWEAGVLILAGTDVAIPHGEIRNEVRRLLDAGLPPEAALGAASWAARSFLGFPLIEEGARADLVAFARNPLEDPSVLGEPELIVLDGKVLRSREPARG
jgi:imidazolonepropionase-like amidohydrolase